MAGRGYLSRKSASDTKQTEDNWEIDNNGLRGPCDLRYSGKFIAWQ
jgi:hypothetical protein